jgi:hypothetical protein
MNDALRDALMIEVRNLLAQIEFIHERRAAPPDLQRVISL